MSLVLLLMFGLVQPATAQVRRVVVLYDERTDLPGLSDLDARLVRTLTAGSSGSIEVYREAMDLSRFPSPGYPRLLREYLRSKYADKQIDVVIAVLGPSLDFLLAHGSVVFPGASIVFCGIDQRELADRRLPANVTGVFLKRVFAPTLRLALALHPGTERVLVVAGSSEFDRGLVADAKAEFETVPGRPPIEYVTGTPLPELERMLAGLPPHTLVLYSTMFLDRTGHSYVTHDAAERVARAANAPVYAFVDQYLGRGIVGGHLYSLDAYGEHAARITLQLLAGTPPSAIAPIELAASSDMFDWRALERWSIDERRLPAGAVVRYREPSLWKQYTKTILVTVVVFMVQALLIAALLLERRVRRRTQAVLRDSEARAEQIAAQQRRELAHLGRVALVGELSAALAHEINQPLMAILTNASAAKRLLKAQGLETPELRSILDDIAADDKRAAAVIEHIRSLIRKEDPHPELLSVNEVVSEVLQLLHTDVQHRHVVVRTHLGAPEPLVRGDRVQLQQVLLNLIVNACDAMNDTPAGRRTLIVSTAKADDALIEVRDQGSGIAPDAVATIFEPFMTTKRNGLGLGLAICRSIVTAHGGRIWATNNAEGGATISVALPLAVEGSAALGRRRAGSGRARS